MDDNTLAVWQHLIFTEPLPDADAYDLTIDVLIGSGMPDTGAWRFTTADLLTGELTIRTDYYAATEEQLSQITSAHYSFTNYLALDADHAVTVPLTAVE